MSTATREAYGKALVELGEKNKNVVVLDADLSKSTKTAEFQKAYPDRFFNIGISEQDMMGTAAGLATCGKIPFASSFAIFATGRAYEQIRNSIGYPKLNVKIAATHAGITVGEDGATHQSIEDISLMRGIPNMVVINPSDAEETRQAILAAAEHYGPVYIRLGKMAVPDIHDKSYKFELGKGEIIREGKDIAIIATGIMVSIALEAADKLKEEGINATVVNMHTIKPIDRELIVKVAKQNGKVVTAEEHSIIGGLGSAVCEVLSEEYPVKVKRIGINDTFGQSGTPNELLKYYNLTFQNIVDVVKSFD
ncbi:transketolase family protein [Thermoanaerobacterium thermosaccharolyticum]|jgi:transketolase|uniref:transketolase family protein n=1 Tax=Thermoanaerobacterium thermosaccharolyticum TaxID=1517 RepID=UPI001239CB28|nr:transketolase family protein [Thermoanaerobacterium thermosaccharolyticum]KAA5807464.1 transketolase family protein [Thermoanaerobacterium thermosaccharolyticum]